MGHSQSIPEVDFDQEVYFTNSDGKRIVCKYWMPETPTEKPSALVCICHGAGEMCHVYDVVAEPFAKHNIVVFAHDHVGHGKSEGDRVHCNDANDYIRDVFQHVDMMKEKHGDDVPVFIIGHSMGGSIAILASMEKPDMFKGVVLISAGIQENPEAFTPVKVAMAKCIASIKPQHPIGKIDSSWISRDPAVCKAYDESPWVWHGKMKAKMIVSMLSGMKKIQKDVETIKVPLLILHGDQHKLCLLAGSTMLAEKAASTDKTLKTGWERRSSQTSSTGSQREYSSSAGTRTASFTLRTRLQQALSEYIP